MPHIRIPADLLGQLCQLAASAPAPYAQTQAMWKAVEALQPEAEQVAQERPGKADEPA